MLPPALTLLCADHSEAWRRLESGMAFPVLGLELGRGRSSALQREDGEQVV